MKIHLHEWAKQQRLEIEVYRLLAAAADGLFRIIEWALVLATLIFLADKTDSWMLNQLAGLCSFAIFVYVFTHVGYDLDIEIWPRPWTAPKMAVTMGVRLVISVVGAFGTIYGANQVAREVAAAGIF